MKNLILAMFLSLDGFTEGPNGEFVQPPWSAEVGEAWAKHNLSNAGHLIYGRVNFEFNKGYWTSPAAAGRAETETMNQLPKTVVSRTLSGDLGPGDLGWNGSVMNSDLAEAIAELKRSVTGGNIYCFGGASLARSLITEDLVDEYFLMVTPNLLGGGKRLFDSGLPKADLALVEAKSLDVGSVILHYERKRAA